MEKWLDSMRSVDWSHLALTWGVRVLGAFLLLLIGIWLARLIARLAQRTVGRAGADAMLASFARNFVYAALLLVLAVMVLGTLGVHTTSLLAILGAAGLAIGLALQGSLANIAAGIMLIGLRPFRVGDYVSVAGVEGSVEQVKIFQTVLRMVDNRIITLPNSEITSAPIINFSARTERRADLAIGIGYEQNVGQARATLLRIAREHPGVLDEPATDVLASNLGENSVDLTLRAWIATGNYLQVRSDLIEAIHREFGRTGISIPYPQRDVHLHLPEPLSKALLAAAPKAADNGSD